MIATSVHAQVLGASFDRLPALLRGVHDARPRKEFSGRTRRFGEQRMQSVIRPGQDALEEHFGPIVLIFGLTAEPDRIVWRLEGARFLFLPLPTALFAGCGASETIVDGRYCFDARAGIAGIGLLVHYKGWLTEHGR